MGLYSDQIAERIKRDSDAFEESFVRLASVVMGHQKQAENYLSDRETSKDAIEEILKYFHVVPAELPANISKMEDQLEFFLRPSGIMRRPVELTGTWYKDGIGPFLGQTKEGRVVALLPGKITGYTFFDYTLGKRVKVTRKNCSFIDSRAYCFYNPLPTKKLSVTDLLAYMVRTLAVSDYVMLACVSLAVVLLSMLTPYANKQLFGNVIASGKMLQLVSVAALLVGATISKALINMTKSLVMAKINTKTEISVQSAAMSRLLSLPVSFFKEFSSGETSQRMQSLNSLCGILVQTVLETGLTALFSLLYIGQIAAFAPALALPALGIILLNIGFTFATSVLSVKTSRRRMESSAKLAGLVIMLFSGVQKIKLAGGERRAFAKWSKQYAHSAKLTYSPPLLVRIGPVISAGISLVGGIVLYAVAGTTGIPVSDFMAFSVSYGMVTVAVAALAKVALTISTVKPTLDLSKPLLNADPETSADKKMLTRLSGGIDINNISFRYNDQMPLVLDDLSLKIEPGQYVAIVGASGCGKSTLIRLLLGFEQPQKGAIYYDGKDMKSVDLRSLRKHIGCVIQNGKLLSGSIYSNIIVSAPGMSVDGAWQAAEMAGIADDIRDMPMGMHTYISEGNGGVSGGQRQRLLIARAIASKPKILMFDEATSALDNITQKHVSKSLDNLNCTRIVIAHRLSTIRQCDRIIMLADGKIVEDGTYDELIALGDKFAELVERQRLDG